MFEGESVISGDLLVRSAAMHRVVPKVLTPSTKSLGFQQPVERPTSRD